MPETVSKYMPQLSFLEIILFHFSAFLNLCIQKLSANIRHYYNFLKGVKTMTYCASYKKKQKKKERKKLVSVDVKHHVYLLT